MNRTGSSWALFVTCRTDCQSVPPPHERTTHDRNASGILRLREARPWASTASAGVIRGVKILGLESRNGRSYLPEALAQAAALYEDAKVNVNHPKGGPGRAARLPGPHRRDPQRGRRGPTGCSPTSTSTPSTPLAEQLALGRRARPGERGLLAQRRGPDRAPRRPGGGRGHRPRDERRPGGRSGHDARPVRGDGSQGRPIFVERKSGQSPDESGQPADPRSAPARLSRADRGDSPRSRPRLGRGCEAEVERLTALEAAHAKQALARRLLREFDLPDPDATDGHARTDRQPAVPRVPAGRARRAGDAGDGRGAGRAGAGTGRRGLGGKPLSRDQSLVDGPQRLDAKAFVEAIVG